jgi:hypothetical protein
MILSDFLSPVKRFLKAPPAISLAERARRLAGAGRYREAVNLLANEKATALDLATLRDLVLWRHAAFNPGAPRKDWPPVLPDPFPGLNGIPEIRGHELTSAILGGSILHHGALLVRGLITPGQTATLAEVVSQAIDAAQSGSEEETPWHTPYPLPEGDEMIPARKFAASCGALWTADSPRALADFLAFLKTHGVVRVIEEYLGEEAFLSVVKSTLRRVPPDTNTGWHQDGAFLGVDIRTVNCWLALSDCGDDAPGLDLYPRRLNSCVEMGTRGAFDWWAVGDGVVDDLVAETVPIASPLFKAGDALLFDQLFLHRTGARPYLKRSRLAIESWFFAGSAFPMDQIPIAL